MSSDEPVIFDELDAGAGKRIGRATLNAPKALNSLSMAMIEQLQPKLAEWDADDNLVAIIIDGAGDKAFCAGGDIIQLYKGMSGEGDPDYPPRFFTEEYRLDYQIHTLKTPCITWGDGIVMGGGMGIFAGGGYKVVTEKARLAMPEITIGLFPDVGGTWFLNRLPGRTGLFLGLTGAHMNAGDAMFLGLADRYVASDHIESLLESLQSVEDWSRPHASVDNLLRRLEDGDRADCPDSPVEQHFDTINRACDAGDLRGIEAGILRLADSEEKFLAKAAKGLASGCPMTAHLIYRQMTRGAHLSLREVFQRELKMAWHCCLHGDFQEGIRALLVDKDGEPKWRHASIAEVPEADIDEHFTPPWNGEHPLADLPVEAP
jgi:enoyl-CoA hydratase/carnithine racemase